MQREAVEALIQELPKFRLKAVPTDCSECPICLEEFRVGNEVLRLFLVVYLFSRSYPTTFSIQQNTMQVRGLPCAHNFHVECIDEWLRLNVKCPRCRCSVFPNLDLSALSNIHTDTERSSSTNVVTAAQYVRNQSPPSQSYLLRLQGLLRPVRSENGSELDVAEAGSSRGSSEHVRVVVEEPTLPRPWAIFEASFLKRLTTLGFQEPYLNPLLFPASSSSGGRSPPLSPPPPPLNVSFVTSSDTLRVHY